MISKNKSLFKAISRLTLANPELKKAGRLFVYRNLLCFSNILNQNQLEHDKKIPNFLKASDTLVNLVFHQ